jgi:hypothetical protein
VAVEAWVSPVEGCKKLATPMVALWPGKVPLVAVEKDGALPIEVCEKLASPRGRSEGRQGVLGGMGGGC